MLFPLCVSHLTAQSTLITGDVAITPYPSGTNSQMTLTKSIDSSQGRFGLFSIQIERKSTSQFLFSYAGVAEEYALFAVNSGVVIDAAYITSTTPIVSNNGRDPGSSLETFFLNQSRYFGYWDQRGFHPEDNYGWALITRTGSGLQVSSSATALGGGIVVGTLTQVPEPTSIILLSLGACLFGIRQYRLNSVS
ncbi:MAG: PEP-CTERM sorting domain-containing protein [Verrucomicrobiota bacterium]|nr:PEP-CTERM sorting domain-containing protein [Verrucomicrobiota bacterium]